MGVETAASDRLPWLADEPSRPSAGNERSRSLLPWGAGVLALVGIGGFWLGVRSVKETLPAQHLRAPLSTTVRLPPATSSPVPQVVMAPEPEVRPAPLPDVRPTPPRDVRISAPARPRVLERRTRAASADAAAPPQVPPEVASRPLATAPNVVSPVASIPYTVPAPWNPRIFAGAAGRLVQVGAFGTVAQAKHGWWFMVRSYPAMAHLPAVVRPTRNSHGHFFYRFQVGTTSQAHSEVLCQRMERIHLSCAVVGLPWKAKVER